MHPLRFAGRALCTGVLLLAACGGQQEPSAPSMPSAPSDFSGPSFRLTIDVATGAIRVEPPKVASEASFSLIGSEAIALHASACTWSSVPKNTRLKRCTFTLAIENTLRDTDLATPTDFPTPPAGTNGLLVFPFTAAAQAVPGTGATPSPDWDHAPANFFNDFASCPTNVTSDCYRWELFSSPLAARSTSAARTVGFDVDKAAQSVSVGIAVAAKLQDHPMSVLTIGSGGTRCGTVHTYGGAPYDVSTDVLNLFVGARISNGALLVSRSFCRFGLPFNLIDKALVDATLVMDQSPTGLGFPFEELGSVLLEHVPYRGDLEAGDFDVAPLQPTQIVFASAPDDGTRRVDVTRWVLDDAANGRLNIQFRLRFASETPAGDGGDTYYTGSATAASSPRLILRYREK